MTSTLLAFRFLSVYYITLCMNGKAHARFHDYALRQYLRNELFTSDEDVCNTEECKAAAETLMASLNKSVDPCEDFYEFSCGGWIKNHPVPPTESHWNQFNVVDKKLNLQLKEMLEMENLEDDPTPVQLARQTYKACMDIEEVEAQGLKPLADILNLFGGWPMTKHFWDHKLFNWQTMLTTLTRDWAVSSLLFIHVYADRKNSNKSVITIDQPMLVLPRSMLVEPDVYKTQIDAYKLWIAKSALLISEYLDENVSHEDIYKDAEQLVQFEIDLAKLTAPNEMRRNGYRTYNPMTLRELQKWTDTAAEGRQVIDWLSVMKHLFKHTGIVVNYSEPVVVRELDFVFNLVKFIEETPLRVIANYMNWRLVKNLNRDVSNQLRQLSFEFDKVFTGATEDQPRWEDCVLVTSNFWSFAVGYKYVELYFDKIAKKSSSRMSWIRDMAPHNAYAVSLIHDISSENVKALEMVGNIRSQFSEQINHVSWMDEPTRLAAKDKLEAMTQFIGYPHWYSNETYLENYYKELKSGPKHFHNVAAAKHFAINKIFSKLREPVDRYEWPTSPAVVNAYYNLQINSIIFPAGILQPPFFSKGRPEALNYGGIGVVIGHEITHGFDDMGRQSDSLGNLAQWWTEKTTETYLKKAQCFIDQYNKFKVPELNEMLLKTVYMNGVTTLGENMADNGGMHQAFLAYNRHVALTSPEERLPGLEEFSPQHLFFIAFATNWCESSTRESLLQEVLNDPHSPHRFRVHGTVANSPEFAKVFNCRVGSPMNPKHKCTFW